jgi:hypothetical protein
MASLTKEIYFIRHGETEKNKQGKPQGNGKRDPVPGLGQATCDPKWVDKECFHCHNLGHPRDKCPFVKGDISAATLHSELEDEN